MQNRVRNVLMEISNLCNNRVAKQSKEGLPGAESSCGESTMLSANYGKQRKQTISKHMK